MSYQPEPTFHQVDLELRSEADAQLQLRANGLNAASRSKPWDTLDLEQKYALRAHHMLAHRDHIQQLDRKNADARRERQAEADRLAEAEKQTFLASVRPAFSGTSKEFASLEDKIWEAELLRRLDQRLADERQAIGLRHDSVRALANRPTPIESDNLD